MDYLPSCESNWAQIDPGTSMIRVSLSSVTLTDVSLNLIQSNPINSSKLIVGMECIIFKNYDKRVRQVIGSDRVLRDTVSTD